MCNRSCPKRTSPDQLGGAIWAGSGFLRVFHDDSALLPTKEKPQEDKKTCLIHRVVPKPKILLWLFKSLTDSVQALLDFVADGAA